MRLMIIMTTVELMKPVELKYNGRKSIVPPIIEFSKENTVDIVEFFWYVDGSAFLSNAGPPPILDFYDAFFSLVFLENLLSRKEIGQRLIIYYICNLHSKRDSICFCIYFVRNFYFGN